MAACGKEERSSSALLTNVSLHDEVHPAEGLPADNSRPPFQIANLFAANSRNGAVFTLLEDVSDTSDSSMNTTRRGTL